jgi:hypothetical protein
MSYWVSGVHRDNVLHVWDHVKGFIESAAIIGNTDIDSVLDEIMGRYQQLWVVYNGITPVAAFTTQLNKDKSICCVTLGGENMDKWLDLVENTICEYGKQSGCVTANLHGRRGWVKALAQYGWKEQLTTMSKEL